LKSNPDPFFCALFFKGLVCRIHEHKLKPDRTNDYHMTKFFLYLQINFRRVISLASTAVMGNVSGCGGTSPSVPSNLKAQYLARIKPGRERKSKKLHAWKPIYRKFYIGSRLRHRKTPLFSVSTRKLTTA
jgi:hypothetical protein